MIARHEQRREGQQAEDRRHEDAPHRQRHAHQRHAAAARLQHRGHVVEAAHRERDDEDRERREHADDAPAVARRARRDRLRRIQRPAGARRTARHEEPGDEHQHREQVEPEAQHVQVREHHVPRAAHQRDEVVAETAEEQRGQQVDHHDHAVHGDVLVIVLRRDERERVGEAQLQAHQHRHHQRDQADADRDQRVLDRDDLVILAPDVLADERLGIVQRVLVVAICDCDECHR